MMIGGGFVVALVVIISIASAEQNDRHSARTTTASATPQQIASSILYVIARLGRAGPEEARGVVQREAPGFPEPLPNADISTWGDAFRRRSPGARRDLLERAVRIAVALNTTLPLEQYNGLLDLSFALGFQTDALARLRARYRFEYVDYAKAGRPREADRGGRQTFFARKPVDREVCLRALGLDGEPSRELLISTYRRLAAKHHPDHHHEKGLEEQEAESRRFIEVTEAYEDLMSLIGRD